MAKEEKENKQEFSKKTCKLTLKTMAEARAILQQIQANNQLALDLLWEIDDQLEVIEPPLKRLEKYTKASMERYGLEADRTRPGSIKTIEVPSEDEQAKFKEEKKERPEWWEMEARDRMEKYMKEYEELLDKAEDVIIKPIKLSSMKEAGIKFSGSMTILRNAFIIKDK